MCKHHLSAVRHPVFCFLPPFVLKNIGENGSAEQRDIAAQTLVVSGQLRGQRQYMRDVREILGATPTPGLTRRVYNANHGSSLPGTLVRSEGQPSVADVNVNEAYDGAGDTYSLYQDVYGRDLIDNQGMPIDSVVHYMVSYDNAFWNGQYMVYGDGDDDLPPAQRLFNRFTISVDVIAHELTHGVTNYEANLVYYQQPGALNESFSDVFGILTKQRTLNLTAAESDWIIGAGLFTSNVNGVGIRSMAAPGTAYDDPVLGKDPQPANMSNYVNTAEDDGGVHINSGIPNHAFYVTSLEIGGYAWEKAGQIWYNTLVNRLTAQSNFQAAAEATYAEAGALYGANSLEQQAVQKGWSEVGITVGVNPPPPPPPPPNGEPKGCLPSLFGIY